MQIYTLVAVLTPKHQPVAAEARPPPPPLDWKVVAEAQAADATGNYRDIAWRLVAAAAAAASDTPLPVLGVRGKEAAAAAAVKRSYSTGDGGHSFNTLMAPAPTPVSVSGSGSPPQASWLLFLCLADAESGTQEAFRFLETLKIAVLASLATPAAAPPQPPPQAPEQRPTPPPPPPARPTSSSLMAALKKPGGTHGKNPSLSSSTSSSELLSYAPLDDEEPPPVPPLPSPQSVMTSQPWDDYGAAEAEAEQGPEAAVRRGFQEAARRYNLEHALAPCRFLPPLDDAAAAANAGGANTDWLSTEEKSEGPFLLRGFPATAPSSLSTSPTATMAPSSSAPPSPSWPPSPPPVPAPATRPLSGGSNSSGCSSSQHEGTWAIPPPSQHQQGLAAGGGWPSHPSTSSTSSTSSSAFTFPPPTSPILGAATAAAATTAPLSPLLPPPPAAGGGGNAARRSLRMQQGQPPQQQPPQPTTGGTNAHAEPALSTPPIFTTTSVPRKPRAHPALVPLDTAAMAPPPLDTEASNSSLVSVVGAVTGAGVRPQSASFAAHINPWALSPFKSKDGLIQGLSVTRGGGGGGNGRGLLAAAEGEGEEEEEGKEDDADLALSLSLPLSLSAAAATTATTPPPTTTATAPASSMPPAEPPVAVVRVHAPPPPATRGGGEVWRDEQWPPPDAVSSGDGGGGRVSTNEAILLPMDYSGMKDPADETHATATATATGEALLREMDTQVKLALQAQIGIAATVDALLSTLLLFRGPLAEIALPPPSAVALEQALKDARRETIVLNGRAFHGDAAGLQAAMRALVAPLVAAGDEDTAELLVQDILRASSRTASGGDAYAVAASLLVRPGNLLTPAAVESAPLSITLGDGVVSIRAENAFALHRNMVPTGDDDDAAAAKQHKRKSRILAGFKLPSASHHHHHHQHHHHHHHHHHHKGGAGGKGGDDRGALEPQQQDGAEEGGEGKGELTLLTVIEVRLHVLQRSCRRVMRVQCPDVERAAPQQLVLGAGEAAANGTYELKGFRGRGPWYVKPPESMQIVREAALAPVPPSAVVSSSSAGKGGAEKEKGGPGGLPLSILRGMSLLAGELSPTKSAGGGDAFSGHGGDGGGGWCIATGKGKPLYCHNWMGKGAAGLAPLPPAEGWEPAHEGVEGPPPTVMPTVMAGPARRGGGVDGPMSVSPPGPGGGVPPQLQLQRSSVSSSSSTTNGRGGGADVVGPRLL